MDPTPIVSLAAGHPLIDVDATVFVQFALFLVLGVMLFVYAQHTELAVPGGDNV